MPESTKLDADYAIRRMRDSSVESSALELSIDLLAEMANFLCDVRKL